MRHNPEMLSRKANLHCRADKTLHFKLSCLHAAPPEFGLEHQTLWTCQYNAWSSASGCSAAHALLGTPLRVADPRMLKSRSLLLFSCQLRMFCQLTAQPGPPAGPVRNKTYEISLSASSLISSNHCHAKASLYQGQPTINNRDLKALKPRPKQAQQDRD